MLKKRNSPNYGKQRLIFRLNRMHLHQGLRLLPNLFTLGNAFFGFCSIIFTSHGDLVAAAYFILLGALMDALDGRVARYAKATTDFGVQLDSLCDAISFGLAPAVLIYTWQLKNIGGLGLLASVAFLLAGLWRLARFNITHAQQSTFFIGTPIPIAGCFLATLVLNVNSIQLKPFLIVLLLLFVLILASLMVSTLPFPTFKKLPKSTYGFGVILLSAFIIAMGFIKMLLVLFIGYFLFSFEEYIRHKFRHDKTAHKFN